LSEQFALLSRAQVLFGRENRQLIRQRASNGCHAGDDFCGDATMVLSSGVYAPEFRVGGVYWGRIVVGGGFAAHGRIPQRLCRLPKGFLGGFFRNVLPPLLFQKRACGDDFVSREEFPISNSLFFTIERKRAREHIVTSFSPPLKRKKALSKTPPLSQNRL
jgi:hypothetical protein